MQDVSSVHEGVKAEMQSLAMRIEEMRRQQICEVETTAQVQATLQRTLSASSSLEMRVGQMEVQQAQARAVVEEARQASKRALQQVEQVKTRKRGNITTSDTSPIHASR